MVTENVLEREVGTFRENKDRLIKESLGKFVVIFGTDIVCVCDTYDEALTAGYDQIGLDKPFLVREICDSETPCHVYRGYLVEC
jgi:hypothetical protein